jgi:DNA-binding transcriptional regulator/RsmH inhibitor MraZ
MIFSGFSELTIDPKQRLALPAKFRAQFDLHFQERLDRDRSSRPTPPDEQELKRRSLESRIWCVTPWPGRGLVIFPLVVWREFSARRGGTLTPSRSRQAADAGLFGLTEQIEMDAAGRLTLPKWITERAGIGPEVAMVGMGDHLEVKPKETWTAELPTHYRHLEQLGDPEMDPPGTAGDAGTTT